MDRKWWTLVAVCTATFMLLLDITIVNVALPSIERDLGADLADLQWVVDAYALTLAALLLTGGSVADRVGRRRMFLIGLVVFTVASVLCGLATSPLTLNLARALQGVGGAFMFATSLALLASAYSGRDRGTALGLWGATTGAAVAVGPLVGGILTEAIGWEAIFFVNVPIGIAAVLLTLARVEESMNPQAGRPDWLGTVLFSGALFLLIFGLIRGNPEGWSSAQIVASLGGAAVLLIAFVVVEMRGEHAMLDLGLFRVPSFVGASIAAFVLSASMFAMFLYLTLYIQNILGYSALESGIRFMPVTLLSFAVAPVSGKFAERLGCAGSSPAAWCWSAPACC
jgi:EmrB/QacA subfamily drug resistance transporter